MGTRATIVLLLAAVPLARPGSAEDLAIIVHPERKAQLTRAEVAQIYLKKRRFWSDGDAIVAVNRDSGSEERALFGRVIFGEDTRQLEVYWNRQYFHGVLPPATLASDEAVRRFVAGERRAIGYIAASRVDASIRTVLAIEDPRTAGARLLEPSLAGRWPQQLGRLLRRLLTGAPAWRLAVR